VLFPGVQVGRNAVVRRAILDKDVVVEPGAEIGVDLERDRERFTVSDAGIVVVPKGERVEA
jgi:glucose-1-phosphate adenylyltransferase